VNTFVRACSASGGGGAQNQKLNRKKQIDRLKMKMLWLRRAGGENGAHKAAVKIKMQKAKWQILFPAKAPRRKGKEKDAVCHEEKEEVNR